VSNNHQQVSKARVVTACGITARTHRDDRFADLVRQVAADPANPFNIDRYRWVLDGPAPRRCELCGELVDAWVDYDGGPAQGLGRRYCSRRCAGRARYLRHRGRVVAARAAGWGRAA